MDFLTQVRKKDTFDGVPIIYVHKGYCPYLRLSLLQARKSNPKARIILIGDEKNRKLGTEINIEFYCFTNYFFSAANFQKVYKHNSKNGYDYEVFCFQRWFILEEFISKESISGYFFYNDSDTFLFCDIDNLISEFVKKYDLSICGTLAPCFVFFKNIEVLEEFCSYIITNYVDEKRCNFLTDTWLKRSTEHIGELHPLFETVSDMTLIGLFYLENMGRMINLSDFSKVKKGVFEENHYLGFSNEFCSRFPLGRKISWKNRQPHYVKFDKERVPVLGFHFQGHAKREMMKLFRGNRKFVPIKEYLFHQKIYYRFILSVCKKKVIKAFS